MGEFHWKELALFLGFAFATFVAYALLLSPPGTLCPVGNPECLREWVTTVFGSVAACASAVALWALVRQTRELRRQTDFLLGDTLPIAQMFDHPEGPQGSILDAHLRLTNLNRSPVTMGPFRATPGSGYEIVLRQPKGAMDFFLQGQIERQKIFIDGWIDRSRAPPAIELAVGFFRAVARSERPLDEDGKWAREHVTIVIDVQIANGIGSSATIKAAGFAYIV